MYNASILLGTNKGDLPGNLNRAIQLIEDRCGEIIRRSSVYRTEPWGNIDQPYFLNQVIEISTVLTPRHLLNQLLSIEEEMGRKRVVKWEPRMIDLDILFYGSEVVREPGLTIPHPHLQERRFTLVPLNEVSPGFTHPVLGKNISDLLMEVSDDSKVTLYDSAGHSVNRF